MTFPEWLHGAEPHFPALDDSNSRPTSPADDRYNCIAWAAGDTERWWWPDPLEQNYWPPGVPRVERVEAFVLAFQGLGYHEDLDDSLQPGIQKIAIFASDVGRPTHAARQLPDGWWASKLGEQIDIEHKLAAIEGPAYGRIAVVLAREVNLARTPFAGGGGFRDC
jgi:hypothetical protein